MMPWLCTTSLNPEGTVCTFSCFDKYAIDGEVSTVCGGNGQWSNPEPVCRSECMIYFKIFFIPHSQFRYDLQIFFVGRCLPFPKFYNGEAYPDQSCYSNRIVKGNTCSFSCDDGFFLVGSSQLTCLDNGNWDKAQPACQSKVFVL